MSGIATSAIMRRSVGTSLLMPLLVVAQANAANVKIATSVGTAVTASDNVDLEPHDQANGGLIWTNSASIDVSTTGERLKAAVDYQLNIESTFSDRTEVDVFNDLAGIGTLEVVPNLFFIEGRAFAGQQLVSPNGRVSGNGTNLGSDTTNVYSFTISPYFRFHLGKWADAEVGADYEQVFVPGNNDNTNNSNNNTNIGNSVSSRQHATISSDELARTNLTAQFEHDVVRAEGPINSSELTNGLTTAEYAVIPEFSLLGTAGYEAINTSGSSSDLSGPVVYAGFDARPGPRSELRFSIGHRFDEIVYDALASYKMSSHAMIQATYGVSFVPAQGGALSLPTNIMLDKSGNLVDVTTGLPVNPGDVGLGLEDQPYIANRAEVSLVATYARDQFSLIGTFEHQDFLQAQPNQNVLVASGHWTHDLSPNLRVGGLLGYRMSDIAMGDQDETIIGRIDLSYDLAENASIYSAYSYTQRFSNTPADEYVENSLTLGANFSF